MDLKDVLSKARDVADGNYRTQLSTIDRTFADASSIVETWNKTGIVAVSDAQEERLKNWLPGLGMIASELRAQASAADRPFLLLRGGHRYSEYSPGTRQNWEVFYSHLTVPNLKRLDKVVASLLIQTRELHAAQPTKGFAHSRHNFQVIASALRTSPAIRINTPRQWHFFFNEAADTKGPEIFLAFSKECRDDPVCRVALRLP